MPREQTLHHAQRRPEQPRTRRSIFPSMRAPRHCTIARMVRGLSQSPPIILSRPASMRLASAAHYVENWRRFARGLRRIG
jgi:hypothetical protein